MTLMQHELFPSNQFTDPELLKEFVLAGRAKITVRSNRSLKHFTYKIKKERDKKIWYVSRLSSHEYIYLGTIFEDFSFRATRKTLASEATSEQFIAFDWLMGHLNRKYMPKDITVFHEGRCGMCGIELTDPISIKEGYGPDCRKKRLHV